LNYGSRSAVLLATWNLENLFRPGSRFGPDDERTYRAKVAALGDRIADVAPDVLAVQEIGDAAALDDVLKRAGGRWQVVLSEFPDERGIRVGLASRSRLADVTQVRAFPEPLAPVQADDRGTTIAAMGRGALSARLASEDVVLVTCHLKSKLLSFGPDRFVPRDEGERARFAAYGLFRRAAEAATVRAHVDAVIAGRPVCVLGDLNDEPTAATTQILLGPPGSEIGTPGFERPDKGDAARLWNLAPFIPEERRFTRRYRGRNELVDHILVSQALVRAVVRVDTVGEPPSIGDDPELRFDEPASDHALLLAEFEV
jgi:endonuclease/exonuclease/phosphatase family metal-dependent hydrolase